MNIFGAFFFSFLMIVRLVQIGQTGLYLPGILLAAQAGFAAFWMIFRRSSFRDGSGLIQWIAWISAILPLAMQSLNRSVSGWLSMPGLLLMLWACWSLGASFSIAPAARRLVTQGAYRLLRHPMYAGEILALFGFCLGYFSLWNWIILIIFLFSIKMRITAEEALLDRYSNYAQAVPWRLIPGVW